MLTGVDMVSISQMAHALSLSPRFAFRVFSSREREYSKRMPLSRASEFLAGRFAVKEAVLKAMHIGFVEDVQLTEIETTVASDGSPELQISGCTARACHRLGVSRWQVSISHEKGLAIAFVVAD